VHIKIPLTLRTPEGLRHLDLPSIGG